MNERLNILRSKLFLAGLVILLLNDFYFKAVYGNWLTGKLSDLAGLFIFPLFLTVILPGKKKACYFLTAAIFTIWKLPLSDYFISFVNYHGIGISRTLDNSDFVALLVLPLSYHYQRTDFSVVKFKPHLIALVAVFAFCATTVPPKANRKFIGVDRVYSFPYSKAELYNRVHNIAMKELDKFRWQQKDTGDYQLFYHYNHLFYQAKEDTLALLLIPSKISLYDTLKIRTSIADINITGDQNSSKLEFNNAYKIVPMFSDKDYRKKAIKEFEKRVIRKL